MTLRSAIIAKLWDGIDPFAHALKLPIDLQGWNSDHPWLSEAASRPGIIVEVGVWKGASIATMARHIQFSGRDSVVIAVDTWLGSAEHWLDGHLVRDRSGTSQLYDLFRSNMVQEGLAGYVVPLPLDSASAATVIGTLGIRPAVLHIDAGHDYASVIADLERWWPLLLPGGTAIMDDYGNPDWPDVKRAVDDWRHRAGHFEVMGAKCRMIKV